MRAIEKRFVLLDSRGKDGERYTLFSLKPSISDEYDERANRMRRVRWYPFAVFDENPYRKTKNFARHADMHQTPFNVHRRDKFRAWGEQIKLDMLSPDAQRFAKYFMDGAIRSEGR